MTRQTIDFGIDLGTTNSAIAVIEGDAVELVRNNANSEFTPSAVRISASGAVTVGAGAKARVETDPDNAKAEFKRRMGLDDADYDFAAAGQTLTATELSAEVLKALKGDVRARLDENLDAAVITIPAAFEAHQTEATREAARLAGIDPVLLQEPTAAAFAYLRRPDTDPDRAFWLVYDFGGGTFDAAVMRLRDGQCQMIAHHGDNHLGGNRIDWDLVDQVLIPAARTALGRPDLARGDGADPRWRGAVARLKAAAETAKIALSTTDTTVVDTQLRDPDGQDSDVELTLTRAQLEAVSIPYIQRSVERCRTALTKAGLTPADVTKILLVGGTTLAPAVQRLLEDPDPEVGLGIPIDKRENPVTVVARGAAVFAAAQLRRRTDTLETAPGEVACRLDFEPVSDDPRPLVGGALTGVTDWTGHAVQFTNPTARPPWDGPWVPVRPDGRFTTDLVAYEGVNTYRIHLRGPRGEAIPLHPDTLTYRLDDRVVEDEAVLPRSLGVGLASGAMEWFAESGDRIQHGFTRTVKLATARTLSRASADVLVIPVLQGEEDRPQRNRPIGELRVEATGLPRDVPAGSDIEVTIEITADQALLVHAFVPLADQEWEAEMDMHRAADTVATLAGRIRDVEIRVADLERRAEITVDPEPQRLLQRLDLAARLSEIRRLRSSAADEPADADACESRINELHVGLDAVEAAVLIPEQMVVLRDLQTAIESNGPSPAIRAELQDALAQIERDEAAGNLTALHGHELTLRRLVGRVLTEDPDFDRKFFASLRADRGEARDPAEYDRLTREGEAAYQRGDNAALNSVNRRMLALLPETSRPERPTPGGYSDSGVDRR